MIQIGIDILYIHLWYSYALIYYILVLYKNPTDTEVFENVNLKKFYDSYIMSPKAIYVT